MATVAIRVGGHEYHVACDDGQEEQLRFLADDIDDRIRSLTYSMGANPGEAMSLLLIALTMADELIENKRNMEGLVADGRADSEVTEVKLADMEVAMAGTLDQIASRIEKIASRITS